MDDRGHKLKNLKSQLQAAQMSLNLNKVAFEVVAVDYNVAKQKLEATRGQIAAIESEIKQLQETATTRPIVTEHAMARFVERVIGVSNDELLARMVPHETRDLIRQLQSGKIPVNDALVPFRLVVRNGVVITVET